MGCLLTSWDPVRTAFRMLMDWGTGAASGCGEEGADRLVICEQVDVWSSDRLYMDLGLSILSKGPIEGGLDMRLN